MACSQPTLAARMKRLLKTMLLTGRRWHICADPTKAPIPHCHSAGSRDSMRKGLTKVAGQAGLGPGQGVSFLEAALCRALQGQVAQLDQALGLVQQQVLQLHLPAQHRQQPQSRP